MTMPPLSFLCFLASVIILPAQSETPTPSAPVVETSEPAQASPAPIPTPNLEPTPAALSTPTPTANTAPTAAPSPSPSRTAIPTPIATLTQSVSPTVKLKGFSSLSPDIQRLIKRCLELDQQGLNYQFGSADPNKGGMDCSGTISFLLKEAGWKNVPRQSDGFYRWTWQSNSFAAVNGQTFSSFEWSKLLPGDLLFWTGTYQVDKKRDPAISHVMLYLGEEEKTGRKLMFGASENRRYQDQRKSGVGIYDFVLPKPTKADGTLQARFIGYGKIPK